MRVIAFIFLVFTTVPALAGTKSLYTTGGFLFDTKRYALSGYDAVAYFAERQAKKGSSKFEVNYKGAVWRFSSQKNLEAFEASPESYIPQYGGHCAWAAAVGNAAPGDPKRWTVKDGKLYLNYSAPVHRRWRSGADEFIRKADKIWAEEGLN